jgi:small ubiquitin-related modifier
MADTASSEITLVVKAQDGAEMQFKVKPTTKFGKMITAYCSRKGLDEKSVRFVFDGQRLNEQSTPAEMDMQSDDVIDVVVEQLGGGEVEESA